MKRRRERIGKVDYNRADWPEQQRNLEALRLKRRGSKRRLAEFNGSYSELMVEMAADMPPKRPVHPVIMSSSDPRHRPYNSKKPLFRTYKMSLAEIEELHRSQGGRCANPGCAILIPPYGMLRAVDHCHETGKVRGMLCKACNLALGLFKDDPKRLVGALVYLKYLDRELIEPKEPDNSTEDEK